jgi:hypothetical protein
MLRMAEMGSISRWVGTCLTALIALAVGILGLPSRAPRRLAHPPPVATAAAPTRDDADADGVLDARENEVARRFAPIVVHQSAEAVYPTTVDEFLSRTSLWLYDDACTPDLIVPFGLVSQAALFRTSGPTCGAFDRIDSYGVRSRRKQRTFFLADIAPERHRGRTKPENWPTYVHTYQNDRHGLTIQYWRFYAYNDRFPYHGGDWEGLHVVLGPRDSVLELALIGHTDISVRPRAAFQWDSAAGGLHPVIGVALGAHTTTAQAPPNGSRHESSRGLLVNLGEKTRPLNGQLFLRYSGLWGSPGVFYQTSGYWGPAFNETELGEDGFVVAWCRGMLDPRRTVGGVPECYASRETR